MIYLNQCGREGFKGCYYNGGGIGYFKGEVLRIENSRYLFKRIYVSYTTYDGIVRENKEDHVWVMDGENFKKKDIGVGERVSFIGEIYLYARKNGTHDLGIRYPDNVEKIKSYELPSDEDLSEDFMSQVRCETCLYNEQCYGICII